MGERTKRQLIRDNGEVRDCYSNLAVMPLWQIVLHIETYRAHLRNIAEWALDVKKALSVIGVAVLGVTLNTLLLPLMPWITSFIRRRDARKHMKSREDDRPKPLPYVWFWRSRLPERKGEPCNVLVRGRMNSCLVEFADGFKAVTSRNAIRKNPARVEK